jgi:hypothetical protein
LPHRGSTGAKFASTSPRLAPSVSRGLHPSPRTESCSVSLAAGGESGFGEQYSSARRCWRAWRSLRWRQRTPPRHPGPSRPGGRRRARAFPSATQT